MVASLYSALSITTDIIMLSRKPYYRVKLQVKQFYGFPATANFQNLARLTMASIKLFVLVNPRVSLERGDLVCRFFFRGNACTHFGFEPNLHQTIK